MAAQRFVNNVQTKHMATAFRRVDEITSLPRERKTSRRRPTDDVIHYPWPLDGRTKKLAPACSVTFLTSSRFSGASIDQKKGHSTERPPWPYPSRLVLSSIERAFTPTLYSHSAQAFRVKCTLFIENISSSLSTTRGNK
jgi:hypothetical protein